MKDVASIISQLEEQKAAIDRAISALREVSGSGAAPVKRGRPGRPPGSGAKQAAPASAPAKRKRRLSPEGRKRIIDALKKRWAAKRSAERAATRKATKKAAVKKTASESE